MSKLSGHLKWSGDTIVPVFVGFSAGIAAASLFYFVCSKISLSKKRDRIFKMNSFIKEDWRVYEIPNESHVWKSGSNIIERVESDDPKIIRYRVPSDFTMSFVFY